jgi:hypothetical protein
LFRLAIVDALIATIVLCLAFFIIDQYGWMDLLLRTVGISIQLFDFLNDALRSLLIALGVSIVLTMTIVIGNAEEE